MCWHKRKKQLRPGFTTGAAAAAAAKAALAVLAGKEAPARVSIRLLTDRWIEVPVQGCVAETADNGTHTVSCTVIKDAGDDPDVTNKAEIGARVWFAGAPGEIAITGGIGVGRITRPGLELPPGEPAINPGPRKMIREAVNGAPGRTGVQKGVHVELFVPEGEAIARRTLNHRLGITGGISILGTTGVVTPLSHEAYIATIESGLSVAKAAGMDTVVLSTGRRSERHGMGLFPDLPEEAFVQSGDFFRRSMELAAEKGFSRVILVVFFGKAVKMAQGAAHTHADAVRLSLSPLSDIVAATCAGKTLAAAVEGANTAREAFFLLADHCPGAFDIITAEAAANARRFAGGNTGVRTILLDYNGCAVSDQSLEKETYEYH